MIAPFFWTMIRGAFLHIARSGQFAGNYTCDQCGFVASVRVTDGMSSFSCDLVTNFSQVKSWPCRHVLVLTAGGKFSISCEQLPSVAETIPASPSSTSGVIDTISCSPKNSAKTQREAFYTADQWRACGYTIYDSSQGCGCDPVADHMCERHQTLINDPEGKRS